MPETILQTIYRFPVKGFPGQILGSTELLQNAGIPYDRHYAITNGVAHHGEWMRAPNYFINARNDGMYKFKLEFDEQSVLLRNVEGMEISFQHGDEAGLAKANEAIPDFMLPVGIIKELPKPQIVTHNNPNRANWDYIDTPISIINAQTVHSIGKKLNVELDPSRFRGNLIIDKLPAWQEFSWMGKRIAIGDTLLDIHRPIDRCPTPGVNPLTSKRDVDVTGSINKYYGHVYCGMYANVVKGGQIKPGDEIRLVGDGDIKLEETFVSNASAYAAWPRFVTTQITKNKNAASILIKADGPWPLPEAKLGQKIRLHMGDLGWIRAELTGVAANNYQIEMSEPNPNDLASVKITQSILSGAKIIISGPYGRV